MPRKNKLIFIFVVVLACLVVLALLIGLLIRYVLAKPQYYQDMMGDQRVVDPQYRGILCRKYRVTASTGPVIGTNTDPNFDLYKANVDKLNRTVSTQTLCGSGRVGDDAKLRMFYHSFSLTEGTIFTSYVFNRYFGGNSDPGLFIAATKQKSDLDRINQHFQDNKTIASAAGVCQECLTAKLLEGAACQYTRPVWVFEKQCPEGVCSLNKFLRGEEYQFTVQNTSSDIYIGYFFPDRGQSGAPVGWQDVRYLYNIQRSQSSIRTNKTCHGATSCDVTSLSKDESLLVDFSGTTADMVVVNQLSNIDVRYECVPNVLWYLLFFLLLPLVILVALGVSLYFTYMRQSSSGGLLSHVEESE